MYRYVPILDVSELYALLSQLSCPQQKLQGHDYVSQSDTLEAPFPIPNYVRAAALEEPVPAVP